MFTRAASRAAKAVFPIFRHEPLAADTEHFGMCGTGFFVDGKGHFLSAAHVFRSGHPERTYSYLGQVPDEALPRRSIHVVDTDDANDIVLGRVDCAPPGTLALDPGIPRVGRSLCVVGYPGVVPTRKAEGIIDVSGIRRVFRATMVLDYALRRNAEGTPHRGFLIERVGLKGMSGGPAIDTAGTALGILAGTITPPEGSDSEREVLLNFTLVITLDHAEPMLRRHGVAFKVRRRWF